MRIKRWISSTYSLAWYMTNTVYALSVTIISIKMIWPSYSSLLGLLLPSLICIYLLSLPSNLCASYILL